MQRKRKLLPLDMDCSRGVLTRARQGRKVPYKECKVEKPARRLCVVYDVTSIHSPMQTLTEID
jgi:hypothetical protein